MKTKSFFAALMLFCATSLWASDTSVDGIWYDFNSSTKTATITYRGSSSNGEYSDEYSGNVAIPASVTYSGESYSVTSIGNCAFSDCSSLTSVTIPNSVTSIGNGAFSSCRGLTSLTIPNSVTSIGEGAFRYVNNIIYSGTATGSPWGANCVNGYLDGYLVYSDATKTTLLGCSAAATGEIVIPNSVTSIGDYAFYVCSGLTSVTIPNSVTSIGSGAFQNCRGLTKVNITDIAAWCNIAFGNTASNPLNYAKHLFVNDVEVTDLVIPNSVTSIGVSLFQNCSSLTSVTIPNSVTSIENSAFRQCSSLTSVTIPNSVTSIGSSAFSGCSSLTSVTIGNSVTSIGEYAFYQCSSLTSVEIPNSVTSIGNYAFYYCSSLSTATIPNSVTTIGSLFEGCNNITSVIWNAKSCSTYNFGTQVESFVFGNDVEIIPNSLCQGMNKLTSVTIPNNVTSIGERTFDGCNNLETVSLGNSLESIGSKAFNGCERIIDIYCYAERVPTAQSSTFDGVSRKAYLWVPANRLRNYETHEIWGEFLVQPMAAEDVNTNTVAVVPDYNTAKIIWTVVENADSYNITITDKDGKTVCTLVFDSNGLLQSIAFGAPSRNNAPEQTQSSGFSFEVSGLEEGTTYDYTIVAKDVASQTLQTFNGSFKTLDGADAVADINLNAASHKLFRNGQLFILRGDKTYTVQGQKVK